MIQAKEMILTIFTPTFNRASLLPQLFESIASQIQLDTPVEWLIFDDGSTDNTSQVLDAFTLERPDFVRWVRADNGGKHRAINAAAGIAKGNWVMIHDSDDYFAKDSIKGILNAITEVNFIPEIGAIRSTAIFSHNAYTPSFKLPENPTTFSRWISYQDAFDTTHIVRRTTLATCQFPEFKGERFMAEGWLWHTLDSHYLCQFVDSPWVIYNYQPDGLSAKSRINRQNSPNSAMKVYQAIIESGVSRRLKQRSKINWWRYYFHAKLKRRLAQDKTYKTSVFSIAGLALTLADLMRQN